MFDIFQSDFIQPFANITWQTALFRLLCACILGGLIGFEREMHYRPAGLRTHMLISMASCLFTLIAFDLLQLSAADDAIQSSDPLRLIDSITSGVAFLVAGSIFVNKDAVTGLTTGAGMWLAGAIGLTCGVGNLGLAVMATGLALTILWVFGWLSSRVNPKKNEDGDLSENENSATGES